MPGSPLSTPVALFIFNRPETTERVFEAIRNAQPQRLLIVADGPRAARAGEAERCEATRAIVARVDWRCEVTTHYSDLNLGCKRRIATGLQWVFEQAEEAIILEDDCLPAPSFFMFCQTLLERYRHDERIFLISGDNFLGKNGRDADSYFFSKYTMIWGWASWRRAFAHYDPDMSSWPEYRDAGRLREVCDRRAERRFWERRFEQAYHGRIDTWDYQMLYACWHQRMLAIAPDKNMVSNIGFTPGGAHIALDDDATTSLPVSDIWDVAHPARIEQDRAADDYVFKTIYQGRLRRVVQHLRRGYQDKGLFGLGHSALDLAQRTARLLLTR
jgi:hypothetical protein